MSETKERPIVFSGEMVKAILAGEKTQTRRIVKPQPLEAGFGISAEVHPYCTGTAWPLAYYERRAGVWNSSKPLICPFGQAGNVLWVREVTFSDGAELYYLADGDCCTQIPECQCWDVGKPKIKPSIFMLKKFCRIRLKITNIRIERLQDISEDDAKAEGVTPFEGDCGYPDSFGCECCYTATMMFENVWQRINGKKYPWEANPWVWVIEFEKIEGI